MSSYQIFVDLGISGTKAALMYGAKATSYLCPPKVADVSGSELQILKNQTDFGGGLSSGAYLQLDENVYALSHDAEGRSNKTTSMLPKSMLAKLRILGAIGELALRMELPRLTLNLGIALPFNEYLSDQQEIISQITEVKSFNYRGREVKPSYANLRVLPEGAGLVQWRKMVAANRKENPNQTYVVVMVGYRDLTFLVFRQGKPPTGEPSGTVRLGYLEYLQSISNGLCSADDPFLLDALLKGSRTVAFPKQPGKVFSLVERQATAEAFYWEQVQHHLKERFAALDVPSYEILVGGGTALSFLKAALETYLSTLPGARVNWMPDLLKEVGTLPEVSDAISQARFADCFGGLKWLAARFAQGVAA